MNSNVNLENKISVELTVHRLFDTKNYSGENAAAMRRSNSATDVVEAAMIFAKLDLPFNNSPRSEVFKLIAANIGAEKSTKNGTVAFAEACAEVCQTTSAQEEFKRICKSTNSYDLCQYLHKFLKRLKNKGYGLNYIQLTYDLLKFEYDPESVRIKWATQFSKTKKPLEKKGA